MNKDHKLIETMELYGGSFASAIAVAAYRADLRDYTRLKSAFPDLWEEYTEMVEQLERARRMGVYGEDAARGVLEMVEQLERARRMGVGEDKQ